MSARVRKVCKHCGGTDVWADANSVWDEEAQIWVLKDTFQNEWCDTCDSETTIEDEEI